MHIFWWNVGGWIFFVPKPTLPPFKWVCGTCHLTKISRQDDDLFYYNYCQVANACVLIRNLKGCIRSLDGPINMIMKSERIKVVIHINEKAFLKLLHEIRISIIQKLSNINIHDSFSLNLIGDLIKYAKSHHDKNSLMCT